MQDMYLFWMSNVVLWGLLLIYVFKGAWKAAFGESQERLTNSLFLGIAATALMMVGFPARWLWLPNDMLLWKALYFLGAADAVFLGMIARALTRRK